MTNQERQRQQRPPHYEQLSAVLVAMDEEQARPETRYRELIVRLAANEEIDATELARLAVATGRTPYDVDKEVWGHYKGEPPAKIWKRELPRSAPPNWVITLDPSLLPPPPPPPPPDPAAVRRQRLDEASALLPRLREYHAEVERLSSLVDQKRNFGNMADAPAADSFSRQAGAVQRDAQFWIDSYRDELREILPAEDLAHQAMAPLSGDAAFYRWVLNNIPARTPAPIAMAKSNQPTTYTAVPAAGSNARESQQQD
jgi:hypothetical protein